MTCKEKLTSNAVPCMPPFSVGETNPLNDQSNTRLTFGLLLLGNFAKSSCNIYTLCGCSGWTGEKIHESMLLFLGNDLQFRMASLANVGLFGPKKFPAVFPAPTSSSASQENSVSRTWYESRQGPSSRGNRLSLRCGCRSKRLASWHGNNWNGFWQFELTDVYGKTKEGPKHPKTSEKNTANPTWVSWSSHFLKCCRLGATQTRNHWPSARWEMPCKHGIALLLSKTFQLPDMEWNWNSMSFRIGQLKSLSLPDPDCAACPHQTHNWHTLAP